MSASIRYSVIIPVYNSEKTLARCLESLVRQNRGDVQIIVVDDGSYDQSGQIARQFAAQYAGVEYLYQENAGVSRARNLGLDRARGEYITFVDSDDYVTEDYFSVLDTAPEADLLVFGSQVVGGPEEDESVVFQALGQCGTEEERLALLLESRKIMPPWNKRFQRLNIAGMGLRFVEGMQIGEDFIFCLAYALGCGSIALCDKKLFCVDISDEDSLSRKYRPALAEQMAAVFSQTSRTVRASDAKNKGQLMAILDYLFIKNVFTGLAEEFKTGSFGYFKNHGRICEICRLFRRPLSGERTGTVHRALRLLLQMRWYLPFYFVSYAAKGRQFQKQAKR